MKEISFQIFFFTQLSPLISFPCAGPGPRARALGPGPQARGPEPGPNGKEMRHASVATGLSSGDLEVPSHCVTTAGELMAYTPAANPKKPTKPKAQVFQKPKI